MSAATIVEPTGVENKTDATIPTAAQMIDIRVEHRITPLKFPTTRIADNAGNIINAEIKSDPTKFMANTIIIAVMTAIKRL